MVGGSCCACGYWWSVWKPKTLCGVRGGLYHFGELVRLSGGRGRSGWIIAHSETLNLQFSGSVRGGGYGYRETFAPFCLGGTWRGRFAWVETSALGICETSGCFSGDMET